LVERKDTLAAFPHEKRSPEPRRLRTPRFITRGEALGFGEFLKRLTATFGIEPCGSCARRALALDGLLVFTPKRQTATVVLSSDCRTVKGKCTGIGGTTQCVATPVNLDDPTSLIVEQCCSGRFQYPWVEICPGREPRQGCSFCLF
jgi:hypothetical protein